MQFKLAKSGTVTECREALNEAIANLPLPRTTEHDVVRAIAHHIVITTLDPIHDPWMEDCNDAAALRAEKGSKIKNPQEPTASFAIDLTITTTPSPQEIQAAAEARLAEAKAS